MLKRVIKIVQNYKVSEDEIIYFRRKLLKWGRENYVPFPWRSTNDLWYAFVAEIMLQRTRADVVEPVFTKFIEKYPTPREYLSVEKPDTFINLGLPERERTLSRIAHILLENNTVDLDKKALLKIPGIGLYTASAIRSMYFGIRDSIIDGNVVRSYTRFFGIEPSTNLLQKRSFKEFAERVTPIRKYREFNFALLDFGRKVCAPLPNCEICPLKRKCEYYGSIKDKE